MICRAIPFEGSEPYLFVSYCHKDQEQLYPLFEQLVLDGYRMWYDDGNHGGDDWLENIENHLEDSSAVVAFISGNSSLSHNCKCEIVYALKCKKKVIPILIDDADLPKGLRMQLSHLHHLKRSDFSSDKALLAKVYEAEECAACKTTPGSLKLKEVSAAKEADVESIKEEDDFWKKYNPAKFSGSEKEKQSVKTDISKKTASSEDKKKKKVIVTVKRQKPVTPVTTEETLGKTESAETIQSAPEQTEEKPAVNIPETVLTTGNKEKNTETAEVKTELVSGTFDDGPATVILSNSSMQALLLQPAQQRAYILRKPQTKIGRSPIKCDVAVEGNESISKIHAEIIQYNGKYFLRDANSTNGTFVKGTQLDAGSQVELENPAVFYLNDERFILLTGMLARKWIGKKQITFLTREGSSVIRIVDADAVALNRNNPWSDGTFSQDFKVHRAAHALLKQEDDGIHLVDESPEPGNGTYLNNSRMSHGESRLLSSGDQIRLGDTTLEYYSITI